jgi:hypothetical protein
MHRKTMLAFCCLSAARAMHIIVVFVRRVLSNDDKLLSMLMIEVAIPMQPRSKVMTTAIVSGLSLHIVAGLMMD